MGGAWVGVGLCVWGMFMGYGWVYGVGLIVRVAEKSRFAGRQNPGFVVQSYPISARFVPGMWTFVAKHSCARQDRFVPDK